MKVWDAIVVGAGPAGCACAYDLSAAGRSVLLLDKADFPRMKACAGGLTMKTVRALRYPVAPIVRQTVHDIVLEGRGSERVPVRSGKPTCVMTVRQELDAYCLQKTINAGAVFQKINGIESIAQDGDGVMVCLHGQTVRGQYLVGADGVNSQVRRLSGDAGWFWKGLAIEANLERAADDDDLVFDFSPISQGYGWVFPKGDHVNVGLYSMAKDSGLNRSRLTSYIERRYGADAHAEDCVGQYLGFGAARHREIAGRTLLVGDAGGFADPLTGEGIYGAVVSGQAAAAAISEAIRKQAEAWTVFSRLTARLRQNLRVAERAAVSFYANPARGCNAMKVPILRTSILKSYAEGFNLEGWIKLARPILLRVERCISKRIEA
jgi:geranylgeranyl reductase family protein